MGLGITYRAFIVSATASSFDSDGGTLAWRRGNLTLYEADYAEGATDNTDHIDHL